MSNAKPGAKRNQSRNRPTDPFGGPPSGRNTISFGIVLIAFAFFVVLQWSGGDLGGLMGGDVAAPTVDAPAVDASPTPSDQTSIAGENTDNDSSTVEATFTASPQTATPVSSGQARATEAPRSTTQPTPTANAPPPSRASDLPTIAYDELPPEAHDTIRLIEQGGPFPFDRDGVTFQNRERLLPRHPQGYYREYTVITPRSNDRGARRIVTGEAGEMYYTADHYESFREIIR